MRLQVEVRLSLFSLIALNLLLAFGVIGLLSRIGPAVDRALVQPAPADQASFDQAADQASGDRPAISAVEKSAEVRRLASAGAWAAAFLGFCSFAGSLLVLRQLRQQVAEPLYELQDTLEAVRAGDYRRRCSQRRAPREVMQVMSTVNRLLDERVLESEASGRESAQKSEHLAVLELLDRQPQGAVLLDRDGKILRASETALTRLSSDEGPHLQALLRGVTDAERHPALEVTPLGAQQGWLCWLPVAPSADTDGLAESEPETPPGPGGPD